MIQPSCKPTSIPNWTLSTVDQSFTHVIYGPAFRKSAAEGSCFGRLVSPTAYTSCVRLSPFKSDRGTFTTLPTCSPRQGQQHLSRLTLPNQVTSHMRSLPQKPNVVKVTDVICLFSGSLAFLKTMTMSQSLSHNKIHLVYFYSPYLVRAEAFSDSKLVPRCKNISL